MKFFQTLCMTAALLLCLAACGGEKTVCPPPPPTPTLTPTAAPAETQPAAITWTEQVFTRSYQAGDGAPVMSVTYRFPGVENAAAHPAWADIHNYYTQEGQAYLLTADELAGFAADDYTLSQSEGAEFVPFLEQADYSIALQTDAVLSVVRSYYANSVTGAERPANYQFCEQFDLSTGQRLALDDFFSDPVAARERMLTAVAEAAAPAGYSRAAVEAHFRAEYVYIDGTSFVVYYQPDTLAPYEAGIVAFSVPYTLLEDLLVYDI